VGLSGGGVSPGWARSLSCSSARSLPLRVQSTDELGGAKEGAIGAPLGSNSAPILSPPAAGFGQLRRHVSGEERERLRYDPSGADGLAGGRRRQQRGVAAPRRRAPAEEGAMDVGGGRHPGGLREEARRGELERGAEEHRAVPVRQELPPPVGEPPEAQPQEGGLHRRGGEAHHPAPLQDGEQVGSDGRSCKSRPPPPGV
jgi:hypothetical protein